MTPREYETIFQVEQQHWWYTGMSRITLELLEHHLPNQGNLQILDAGCGTGGMMQALTPLGRVTGCDLSPLALQFCHRRGLSSLGQATVDQLPFAENTFDLVTSFDVLYHEWVTDYTATLYEFWRVLRPGGMLFLRLPAYDWLRGHHDDVIFTRQRFTTGMVRHALLGSQFRVEKLSYANTLLFPLALGKRLAERIRPPAGDVSDVQPNAGPVDALLSRFLIAEARWLNRHNLPFGLSVVAIGQKIE